MGKYLDNLGLSHLIGLIKTALSGKQATLVSGTNIKTINNQSLLGSGNIDVSASGAVTGVKGDFESAYRTGNVNLTAANIGAAAANHWHAITDVTNLQATLNGKATVLDLENYLPLSGGTVIGNVTVTGNITAESTIYAQDAHMHIKRASLDTTAANNGISADSYLYHGWIDKNSKFSGWCGNIAYTDGRIATQLAARRVNSSTNLDNVLVLAVNPNGSRTVTVSDAAPWRSALGLGTAATMDTGTTASTVALGNHTHSQYFSNTANHTKNTVLAAPNGSNGTASFRSLVLADLPSDVQNKLNSYGASNQEIYMTSLNGLRRLVLTNGNNLRIDTRASTSNEWTNGLYYPGIAPVNETTIANVITQTSTQSTNNPITAAKYYKVNSVSMVEITFKPAAARSAGTAISLGTIVSGKRPHFLASGGSDRITGSITSAGVCNLYARTALTANTAYTIGFMYIT